MVFIAHSKRDRETVLSLYRDLKGWGFDLWMDEVNLLPGQSWEHEIRTAIDKATVFLVCISSQWVDARSYVQKEVRFALRVLDEMPEGRVYIIPVRLDDCSVPSSLRHLQWVNAFESGGMQKLLAALNAADSRPNPKIPYGSGITGQMLTEERPLHHSPVGGIFAAAFGAPKQHQGDYTPQAPSGLSVGGYWRKEDNANSDVFFAIAVEIHNDGPRTIRSLRVHIEHPETHCRPVAPVAEYWTHEKVGQFGLTSLNPWRLRSVRDLHPQERSVVLIIPCGKEVGLPFRVGVGIWAEDYPHSRFEAVITAEELELSMRQLVFKPI